MNERAGIYIHIPFCKQACSYCNFHFSTSLKQKNDVLAAINLELRLRGVYLAGKSVQSIYFGGGTPSILNVDDIENLLTTIGNHYKTNELSEVTLEGNPDDLTPEYLAELAKTKVNRLSIGIQSFREQDLAFMNRAHTAQQAIDVVKAAHQAGFDNLSIDLIYGTPGLTDTNWAENIEIASKLGVTHMSCYALTIEPKTKLHHDITHKHIAPMDNAQAATQFELLMNHAPSIGFEHYEISNLAKNQKYALHNTSYWSGNHYLGVGPSAHSYNGHSRAWNVANNSLYTTSMLAGGNAIAAEETLSPSDKLNEYLMVSLRTQWGGRLDKLQQLATTEQYSTLLAMFGALQSDRYLNLGTDTICLTQHGKLFADKIASDLFQ
jgi:oxygen-independent coproporphyrinogen III oxidase